MSKGAGKFVKPRVVSRGGGETTMEMGGSLGRRMAGRGSGVVGVHGSLF